MGEERILNSQRVAAWQAALVAERPLAPDESNETNVAELTSFSATGAVDGVLIKLVVRGDNLNCIKANPVVVLQFAATIIQAGIHGGWLDDEGDLVVMP